MGVRAATREDVHAIHALIVALATYERAPDSVIATPDDLERALFGASPSVFAHVVEHEGAIVGFALWFTTYSTWLGKHGLWLEDLFVLPEHRGRGWGKALLAELARIAHSRGYGRLEWNVLDWNEPAIAFYRSLGASALDAWTVHRLEEPAIAALAGVVDQRSAPRSER
ncbi:MAG: GNAT family N-acetyltransferase [Sandaracinaceae bacterium]|nr:GNAT family N-acetyltransferase [Sandaracinaceae bacterium]